ncbi:unnamed protein product [Bursaphelenchus okinawaensis]|uniref:Uncharacterized protein n=1 Tax=Bursaphelenchus okinawaensis TaxID=465554 RepID=A0A811LTK4_9BILA|nr:unnamed protein product [Bursaphelenchus okinawaensis]CAG9127880.1 unnamed protein product [Bursaphelenchus okinawaensis]
MVFWQLPVPTIPAPKLLPDDIMSVEVAVEGMSVWRSITSRFDWKLSVPSLRQVQHQVQSSRSEFSTSSGTIIVEPERRGQVGLFECHKYIQFNRNEHKHALLNVNSAPRGPPVAGQESQPEMVPVLGGKHPQYRTLPKTSKPLRKHEDDVDEASKSIKPPKTEVKKKKTKEKEKRDSRRPKSTSSGTVMVEPERRGDRTPGTERKVNRSFSPFSTNFPKICIKKGKN